MPRTAPPTELSPLLDELLSDSEREVQRDYETNDDHALELARHIARRLHEHLPREASARLALYAAGVWLNRKKSSQNRGEKVS